MGEGEAPGDEVLLWLGLALVDNLQDTSLELGNDGNVVGSDSVLSGGAWDNDLRHLRLAVDGLVGEIEVKGHAPGGLGGRRHGPAG